MDFLFIHFVFSLFGFSKRIRGSVPSLPFPHSLTSEVKTDRVLVFIMPSAFSSRVCIHVHIHTWKSKCYLLSHVWLCVLIDCSPPGSSVHGILQARILEWVAFTFSRGSSWPRDQTYVCCIERWVLYHWATSKAPFRILNSYLQTLDPQSRYKPKLWSWMPAPSVSNSVTLGKIFHLPTFYFAHL